MKFKLFDNFFEVPSRNGLTKPKNVRGEGFKMVNMGELFKYPRIHNIDMDRVHLSQKEKDSSLLIYGDLLFARQSLVLEGAGKCSIFLGDVEPVCFESHLIRCRLNPKIVNPVFIYYFFNSSLGKQAISAIVEQGAGAAGIRSSDLAKIMVPDVSINLQNKIAKILGDLDDKIAINTQINQTLEAMAQALFKSWFVDFDPVKAKMKARAEGGNDDDVRRAAIEALRLPKGSERASRPPKGAVHDNEELSKSPLGDLGALADLFPERLVESELGLIPEGWEVKALGAFIEIKRGGSPRPIQDFMIPNGYPWVKIADATADKSPFLFSTKEFIKEEGLRKTVYLKKESLILSNSATPGLPKFLQLDACIHDGWLYFPKIKHFSDTYLYFLFLKIRTELVAQGNGSVFTNLKTDILRNQLVVVPSISAIKSFTKYAGDILNSMRILCEEMQSLSETRDALLPKLLSGEIDLSSFGDEVRE